MTIQVRRRGRHVKPSKTAARVAGAARLTLAGSLIGTLVAAVFVSGGLVQPMPSQAAALPGHSRAWWDRQTCGQFEAWRYRHSDHPEDAALADSRHADYYLRSDIAGWVRHRERQPWTGYVVADCTTSPDE